VTLPPDFSFQLLGASQLSAGAAAAVGLVSAYVHLFGKEGALGGRLGRWASTGALLLFVAGLVASLVGVGVRWHEVNHYPVQTMFEAITTAACALYVAYAVLHVVLGLHRTKGATRGLADLFLALVMAGEVGLVLFAYLQERGPRTLPPALQSYWMPFHVSSLLLSYVTLSIAYLACLLYFTLKLVRQVFGKGAPLARPMSRAAIVAFLGFVFLVPFAQVVNAAVFLPVAAVGVVLARTGRLTRLDSWIEGFDRFSFAIFGIGFPFLTAGLMMGAFWAQEAWALYWGWDSKETSALISWLIYLAYLHLRFVAGWKDERGLWVILGGAVSILITFQLFGYLPASQDSLHKYTDGISREGTELSGSAANEAQAGSPSTPTPPSR
jgi:cytochrome c-type biogenesis protein CcsB